MWQKCQLVWQTGSSYLMALRPINHHRKLLFWYFLEIREQNTSTKEIKRWIFDEMDLTDLYWAIFGLCHKRLGWSVSLGSCRKIEIELIVVDCLLNSLQSCSMYLPKSQFNVNLWLLGIGKKSYRQNGFYVTLLNLLGPSELKHNATSTQGYR